MNSAFTNTIAEFDLKQDRETFLVTTVTLDGV